MSVSALFDIGGYNGTGIVGLNSSLLWHPKTIEEIEKAYPRSDFYQEGVGIFDREFMQKPNCLMSHYPGGVSVPISLLFSIQKFSILTPQRQLDALLKDLRVGPIVPEDSRARNVCGPHFRD
jgi:hypothetical protein